MQNPFLKVSCTPVEGSGKTGDEAIKQLNADYQIYKTVEQQLLHRKTRLLAKLPDLQRALDMVNMLKDKSGDEVRSLCDSKTLCLQDI